VEERICSYRPCILCIAEAKNQRTMEDSLLMYETKNSSESEARGCRTAEREVEGGGVLGREFRNKKPVGSCRRNQPHHVLGRDAVGELVGAAHPEQRVPTCHLPNVRILRGVPYKGSTWRKRVAWKAVAGVLCNSAFFFLQALMNV
jgi:hypothetical protein